MRVLHIIGNQGSTNWNTMRSYFTSSDVATIRTLVLTSVASSLEKQQPSWIGGRYMQPLRNCLEVSQTIREFYNNSILGVFPGKWKRCCTKTHREIAQHRSWEERGGCHQNACHRQTNTIWCLHTIAYFQKQENWMYWLMLKLAWSLKTCRAEQANHKRPHTTNHNPLKSTET